MGIFFPELNSQSGQIRVSITGGKRLVTHLQNIKSNMPKVAIKLTEQYANDIVSFAKNNVETRAMYNDDYTKNIIRKDHVQGTLRDSIAIISTQQTDKDYKIVVGIEPTSAAAGYAGAVEYGRAGGKKISVKNPSGFDVGAYNANLEKYRQGLGHKPRPLKSKMRFYSKKYGKIINAKEIIQGPQSPMYFMRDGVDSAITIMRQRIEEETGRVIAKK